MKIDDLHKAHDEVWPYGPSTADQVQKIMDKNPGGSYLDEVTLLRHGPDWVLEPLRTALPTTREVLDRLGLSMFVGVTHHERIPGEGNWSYFFYLYLGVDDRLVCMFCPPECYNFEKEIKFSLGALPFDIAKAYYSRVEGWHIPSELPPGVAGHRMLPCTDWLPIDEVLNSFVGRHFQPDMKPEQIDQLQLFCHYFPELQEQVENGETVLGLRAFLDGRPSGQKPGQQVGDILLVRTGKVRDQEIYLIPNGDVSVLRRLVNPLHALDVYTAHIFSGAEEIFSFWDYSEPMPALSS